MTWIKKGQFIVIEELQQKYKTKKQLIENFFLAAFIDSYQRIPKTPCLEEKIRDMFIADFERVNPLTKDLFQLKILFPIREKMINAPMNEQTRADISLIMPGFEFIIECKLLKCADSKYLEKGIKRFVQLKYSQNDTEAGMIGFVIEGDIKRIVDNLRDKVKQFHYASGNESLLEKKCAQWPHSFQSKHDRELTPPIHLYHLFFDFSQPN